ncbi:MAG: PAS domain-containing protein [Verrucomicrobia bacterium]|nr:PAS domain-containing protein [Verrucomicrobiota bacterium]
MPIFHDRPIRQKIMLVIMAITAVVLFLAFGALFYFQAGILRQQATHELALVGEITARECGPAVRFKDQEAANQILSGLKGMPQVVSARLEVENHQRLAFFGTARDESEIKTARLKSGFRINGDRIILAQPVTLGGTQEGTLCVLSDLRATRSQLLKLYASIFGLVLLASLLVTFILSRQFLRFVTDPILQLADTAQTVADHNDYSVRATKSCHDETGVLTDAFNQMLDRIESQDRKLRGSEEKLAQAQRIAHLGYWERNLETNSIYWSDETYRIFGLQPEESVTDFERFQQLLHPDDRELVIQASKRAINGGPRYDVEYRAVRPDGEVRFIRSQGDVVRNESGKPVRMFGTAQDITEQKRAEQALRDAEQKYRAIFENAIEGMFQSTPNGKFLSVNPALARMFGFESPEELIVGVNDIQQSLYVDPQRRDEFKKLIETQGSVELFEYEIFRKDKTRRWLCENSRAVRDRNGEVCYYEGTVEDVTERRRVEEVERANKAKSEFLSRVSHELRTPLNAILGFGQLLERQEPTEKQRPRLRHIINAGQHLLGLINEVLDISRIETGKLQVSLEPVSINDALAEAIDLMRPLASQRKVELSADVDLDASVHVMADRQRLKQVLLNLLANGVKYIPQGGSVSVSCLDGVSENLRVSISDTGPGIPAEKISRLFIPFERLGAEHSNVEGTGLGLALSRRLMEAMRGSIGVDSVVGKGTTFWVELPRTKSPIEQAVSQSRNSETTRLARPAARKCKLLYIEDNLSNLALIEQMLEERPEIELMPAIKGKLGLELAEQYSPDLILLDLHLPDIAGWEVLAQLKAQPKTSSIPVIVISADATKPQINRLIQAGASTYLTKPLDVNQFFSVIDEARAKNGAGDAYREQVVVT